MVEIATILSKLIKKEISDPEGFSVDFLVDLRDLCWTQGTSGGLKITSLGPSGGLKELLVDSRDSW